MHSIEQIRWTTRADVCAQLQKLLLELPPQPHTDGNFSTQDAPLSRERALSLLFLLADDSCVPMLRQMLLSGAEEQESRGDALRSLWGLEAALSEEEFGELLRDQSFLGDPPCAFTLTYLLELCASQEAQQLARALAGSLAALDRARLLYDLAGVMSLGQDPEEPTCPATRELFEWLYRGWLARDRRLLDQVEGDSSAVNIRIASWTRERPESQAVLVEYWRRLKMRDADGVGLPEGWRQELVELLRRDAEVRALCAADDPAQRQQLAEAFALPLPDLIRHFGAEPLLLRIEQKLRAASVAAAAQARRFTRETDEAGSAICLLEEWPDAGVDDRICSLLQCPDFAADLKWDLMGVLRRRDRDRAVAAALAAARAGGDTSLAQLMVRWVGHDPRATDRDLLRWGSRQKAAVCLYYAVEGLEQLGEDGPEWRRRLQALSTHRNPFVRLRATAALVRRGHEDRLPELIRDAIQATDVSVRGEALRMLGELDAKRHFMLLRRALLEDHVTSSTSNAPAGEEAALALARLGTPEALTAMIQGYLITPNHLVLDSLGYYLALLIAPAGQQREQLQMPADNNCRAFRDWRRHPI